MDEPKIPMIVYEVAQVKHERTLKRLIIALMFSIALIFVSNALWLYAWSQYDYSSKDSVLIDGTDGIANYIGNDGVINNGEDSNN